MSSKLKNNKKNRIAIVDREKCKPHKCNKECKKYCPVESQGINCINIIGDMEDITGPNKGKSKQRYAKISETACISCGICVKKCPFDAIKIVNIPSEIGNFIVHRYSENGFRLYKMPVLKSFQILGILGQNGIGKTTVMQILSDKIKPNFEEFDKSFIDNEIISKFKGNEMHKYMEKLYNKELNVVIKPQHVDQLIKYLAIKKQDPNVREYLNEHSDYQENDDTRKYVIENLELDNIMDYKVKTLSGGELQRLVCASTILKKANVYIFDEATNFLDVKQRLKIAHLIRSLLGPDKYIVVIEHDLAILDYLADYICLMYGNPGAYGVVSVPCSTANAINIFFDGYIPAENMRFRKEEYNIDLGEINYDEKLSTVCTKYSGSVVEFPNFRLTIQDGSFPSNSSITVILGENGTGKTTFIKYLSKYLDTQVSYKPQYLNIEEFFKNGKYPTVEEFYHDKIRDSYINEMFKSDVMRPMQIENIKNRKIDELSGGELQRFWIVYCLGTNSHIYLIDEPSACLDIEQRVIVTKIIKRFIIHNKKICFVVEHDIMMAVSMAQEMNSQIIVMDNDNNKEENKRSFTACKPMAFREGINKFLKSLDITFRTDAKYSKHNRPRINKYDSIKDREQKASGQYYQ